MAPPDKSDRVEVSLDALRNEADIWSVGAEELAAAERTGVGLELSMVEFSYLGDLVGLPKVYWELRDQLCRLLAEGADAFAWTAWALREVADGYQQDDVNGAHRLHQLY